MKVNRNIKYFATAALALLSGLALAYYMVYSNQHPSTDDAYVKAHIIQIAPQVSGRVAMVAVQDHQQVRKGQLLYTIDPQPFQIALAKAQANLTLAQWKVKAAEDNQAASKTLIAQRQAELKLAVTTLQRYQILYQNKYIAKQTLDTSVKQVAVAKNQLQMAKQQYAQAVNQVGGLGDLNAQIKLAKANVANAQLNLKYTKVYAPTDGVTAELTLRAGDAVTAYQQVFSLIDEHLWWVEANFKETQLSHLHTGQTAAIHIDMYPGVVFHGKVSAIAYGSGDSFSLMPTENASGNWVKVTQRFAVKVLVEHPPKRYPLRVGSSASVTVSH